MDYKNGKWSNKIISMQHPDGSWGCFHTLRRDSDTPITTEQALTRLECLGYTAEDKCIKRAIAHMEKLLHTGELPEGKEKTSDFENFVDLIVTARIRRFTDQCESANEIAGKWAQVITKTFSSGTYSRIDYDACYTQVFGRKPKGGRLADFVNFYQLSILPGMLDKQTESIMLDYVLRHEGGIYYVYENRLDKVPEAFQSKKANRYLAAIELLTRYESGKDKLSFAYDWLKANQQADGTWDMGAAAKDGVYFPLSDRWDKTTRITDSTYRISKLFSLPCYCGHDCARCITYIATLRNDDNLRRQSQSFYKERFGLDIPLEKFNCEGGRSQNVFELCKECPFVKCCKERSVDSCSKCPEYPCKEISDYQAKYVNKCNQI
jgi:hypothetical protein